MSKDLDDTTLFSTPPALPEVQIYISTTKNYPAILFSLGGDVVLTISEKEFLARGLTPIATTDELYKLMLDFFQRGKR